MSNFLKIRAVGAELLHAQRDRDDEENNHFSQFRGKSLKLKYINYLIFPVFITHC